MKPSILLLAAIAHHSIAGVYDGDRKVTVEGVIVQFQFVNPHPFVTLEVQTPNADPQRWRLEMDNRPELVDAGMTSETLRPGDRVIVTGSPARAPQSQSLYI